MKFITTQMVPFAFLLIFTQITINSAAQNEPYYDPSSGKTVYRISQTEIVQYDALNNTLTIIVKGKRRDVNCRERGAECKDALEDAKEGTPPFMPEEPGGGGDDGGEPDGGDDNGGGSPEGQSYTQSPEPTSFLRAFNKRTRGLKGHLFFKPKKGNWMAVKNREDWHKKLIASISKR